MHDHAIFANAKIKNQGQIIHRSKEIDEMGKKDTGTQTARQKDIK